MPPPTMLHYYLICASPDVPSPEEIAAALKKAEFRVEIREVRRWGATSLNGEFLVGNSLSELYLDVSEDFQDESDSLSDREMLAELVDGEELEGIRRLVSIRAWDHTDAEAVQCLIEFVETRLEGKVVDISGQDER
jgi:hypothetical protein